MKRIVFFTLLLISTAADVLPVRAAELDRGKIRKAFRKPVTIHWDSRDCAEALNELSKAVGCPVAITPELVQPSKLRKFRFQLRAENVPLQRVFDMYAATLGGVYWIETEFGIWFGNENDVFTSLKFRPVFYNIHGLEKQKQPLVPKLKEFFKLETLCGKKAWIQYFEKDRSVLSTGLPDFSHERMRRLLSMMSPAAEPAALEQTKDTGSISMPKKVTALSIRPETDPVPVNVFCRLLSEKTGFSVNWNVPAFAEKKIDTIALDSPAVTLEQRIAQLDNQYGIKLFWLGKGGLWLDTQTYPAWKDFSFEAEWQAVQLRAFRLKPDQSTLTGKALVHLIRKNVYPRSWKTPCAVILFRQRNHSIIVMHYPRVLAAVEKIITFKTQGESNE